MDMGAKRGQKVTKGNYTQQSNVIQSLILKWPLGKFISLFRPSPSKRAVTGPAFGGIKIPHGGARTVKTVKYN